MILNYGTSKKAIIVFLSVLTVFVVLHLFLLAVSWDFSDIFNRNIDSTSFIIDFAPEIWLAMLSVVLGTLIIVISIASQSNPKLIDYYISDYPSLIYTTFITIAGIENIYLQLNLSVDSIFYNNVVFINSYLLMPLAIVNIIPYSFYILSYTKTSSLIETITKATRRTIDQSFKKMNGKQAEAIQFNLLETINQLDDQHGFVNFKEPKSAIIISLGELIRYYLENKSRVNPSVLKVTKTVKHDISFKTLVDEFESIEKSGTFLEHKIFKVYSGIYLQLIDHGFHDLAALCSNELNLIGQVSFKTKNTKILKLSFIQFNTFLRFGIKHASQHTDIRHVFNAVFQYTQMILFLVENNQGEFVKQGCQHLTYYSKEIYELSLSNPHFVFLVDSFASEIQKILIAINQANYSKEIQMDILKMYSKIEPTIRNKKHLDRIKNTKTRSIKIALILFYLHKSKTEFENKLIEDIVNDLRYFDSEEVLEIIKNDCLFLKESEPKFWEFSDRGDKNIYFTPYKNHLDEFYRLFTEKLSELRSNKNYRNDFN